MFRPDSVMGAFAVRDETAVPTFFDYLLVMMHKFSGLPGRPEVLRLQ